MRAKVKHQVLRAAPIESSRRQVFARSFASFHFKEVLVIARAISDAHLTNMDKTFKNDIILMLSLKCQLTRHS